MLKIENLRLLKSVAVNKTPTGPGLHPLQGVVIQRRWVLKTWPSSN